MQNTKKIDDSLNQRYTCTYSIGGYLISFQTLLSENKFLKGFFACPLFGTSNGSTRNQKSSVKAVKHL